jgi:AcrR family transcriptional regulator
MSKPKTKRRYDASGRQARARENRERMLDTARRLFAERGYAATTLEGIAAEAGVALPTVYAAFRSKRGLLDGVMRRLIAGEPDAPPLLRTAGARQVLTEHDPRQLLHRLVEDLSRTQERVMPLYTVLKNAVQAEPDLVEMLDGLQRTRLGNLTAVAKRLAALGGLRPGLTVEEAGRTLWAIASPEVRELLTGQAGWTADRYRGWLAGTLAAVLLA